ncbi:MAG TPA: thioredoxin domain-containing protein [Terracidiphilus sp.]
MICLSLRTASLAALVAFSLPAIVAPAQQNVPPAPAAEPAAPAPAAAPVFPPLDPANFTASSPTKETVNGFLQASWGYDQTRVWEVAGIFKTSVDGISKVVIYVGDKTGKQKTSGIQFFALADGKHIIAGDEILPFGDHPYADNRALIKQQADGPYRGAADKDFLIVEFADFQCPHCKDAQANMEKLATDFPKARIVYQNYPLPQHKEAAGAAAYGVCVAKQGGSSAFYTFAAAVFDGQDGLASPDGATLTLNSAVTKAGLDPVKIAACAKTPATVAEVDASVKLAKDLGVNQTPTLLVNGRQVPANAPYDTIKQIVEYQEKLDGLSN